MKELTAVQKRVLLFVIDFQKTYDRAPNGPEIADHFGYRATQTAYQHLRHIAKKGYLCIDQPGTRKPLRITLTEKAERRMGKGWPVFGRIPAGPVDERGSDAEARVESLRDFLPMIRPDDFFLTVEGDSMKDAGLTQGMRLLMRPTDRIQAGDICAVYIHGDGGTLKRVYERGDAVELCPANDAYESRRYPHDRVEIQGVLIAAIAIQAFHRKRSTDRSGQSTEPVRSGVR